ncbi:MAG: hypothetical protein K6F92_04980 [Lachnospiraceae bacterium]|nr:hypothetical protein [Lachnospiraceae bacterium]
MKDKIVKEVWRIAAAVLIALLIVITLRLFHFLLYMKEAMPLIKETLRITPKLFIPSLVISYLFVRFFIPNRAKAYDIIYRFRYVLAFVVLALCVIFELNGSSIAEWGAYLGYPIDDRGILIGTSRGIRGDEYATLTPLMLSQYHGGSDAFSYFSEIVRGTSTDVFMEYGAPVRDLAVLFRPFHWGFLFLSAPKGFSFWWCSRAIALLMGSFELGMLITGKNRKLSVIYTALVFFSPVVAWWFAINGLVEMLALGQIFIVLLDRLLSASDTVIKKVVLAVAMAICGGSYIFTMYPSWEVALGYIFLALFIWVMVKNRETLKNFRAWVPYMGVCVIIIGAVSLYILSKSGETIKIIMNTVYPGLRENSGDHTYMYTMLYAGNSTLAIYTGNITNQCEFAMFYGLAPLGILLTLYLVVFKKKRDVLLVSTFLLEAVLILYTLVGFPSWLEKITLMSHCAGMRTAQMIGFGDIILLIRCMMVVNREPELLTWKPKSALLLISTAVIAVITFREYDKWLETVIIVFDVLLVAAMFGAALFYTNLKKHIQEVLVAGILIVMFYVGGMVNPVQRGLDVIYESDIYKAISSTVERDSEGLWITDVEGYPINDLSIMAGARTIDCINIYPALERWRLLDPTGECEDIYNRYAHIWLDITYDRTEFEYNIVDGFKLYLAVDDLHKLDIAHVISRRDLTAFNTDSVTFSLSGSGNGLYIYDVIYE